MKNAEFYKDEILRCACEGRHLAVNLRGEIADCNRIECDDCAFSKGDAAGCDARAAEWLRKEYVDPIDDIDWERVPVDTPVIVGESTPAWHRHFAKCRNGNVYCWDNGYTSFTAGDPSAVSEWSVAKLYRQEDVEKYRKR